VFQCSGKLEGHRIRTMQPASGANKDIPVLRASHWGGGQSSVWRTTRRIGLAARCRIAAHSSARLIGLDLRRLWRAAHIGGVAAADMSPVRAAPDADPVIGRGSALLRTFLTDFVLPLLMVGAMSLVLGVATRYASFELHSTLYLIPVIISAVRWGIRSAVVAALASVAVFDFFFLTPFYSFSIADPSEVVDLAVFLVVALVTGNLAAALRREADRLRRRERDVHNLHLLSRRLALCSTDIDLVAAVQDYLTSHLGCRAFLIQSQHEAGEISIDDPAISARLIAKAAEMVAEGDTRSRLLVDPDLRSVWALKSIATRTADHGVLAVDLGQQSPREAGELNDRVEAILSEAAAALERIDAGAAFANANQRLQSDFLKSALIGSVSHQLRSPIASILGSTSVLDGIPALRDDGRIRSLVDGMHREAKRLDSDIQNLLDTVRITDSGIKPVLEWADPADLVTAAIRQRSHRLDGHKLVVDVEDALPLLKLDSGLVEQALGQVIENAGKYSPLGSTVTIAVRAEADEVVIAVADNGMGLLADEASSMFKRAFRGRRQLGSTPGLGLGLWIARIFVAANGGAIAAHSSGPGGGTTVTIRFPVHEEATALTHVQVS
jgi:two-component system, OmpR family, sensor histidine kinase KdpD